MANTVTATWNKSSFTAGETMTGTVSGTIDETTTTVVQQTVGPVTVPLVVAGGDPVVAEFPAVQVAVPTTTTVARPAMIDTALFNPNQGGRTWAVSADKLRITAVA